MVRYSKCAICGNVQCRLHKFPRGVSKPEILQKWKEFCKISDSSLRKNWFLCDKHFTDDCFRNSLKEKLHFFAVPTLFPPKGPISLPATLCSNVDLQKTKKVEHSNAVNDENSRPSKNSISHCRSLSSILRESFPELEYENLNNVQENVKSPESVLKTFNKSKISSCDDVFVVDDDDDYVSTAMHCVSTNKYNEKSDLLLAAIRNSQISFADDCLAEEEVVASTVITNSSTRNEDRMKKNKQVLVKRKKNYFDPVLINSVLEKMTSKKGSPVRIVTLEKKPEKLFKGLTKNKIVTLYRQNGKRSKSSNKLNGGRSVGKNKKNITDKAEKVFKRRKCTCTIHCLRQFSGSKNSPPIINVSSGVGAKFVGAVLNPELMNIDEDLSDSYDSCYDNVFNVSTILTNVEDKSQIEQLCQLLIESVFRLKNMNIEETMGKLQVYISQIPLHCNDKVCNKNNSIPQLLSTINRNEIDATLNSVTDTSIDKGISTSNCSNENSYIPIPSHNTISQSGKDHSGSGVLFDKLSHQHLIKNNQKHNFPYSSNFSQNNYTQVKVNLSTFHDHNYIKHDSNFIFEKPEYLVKLIDIDTYKHPHKKIKSPLPVISKKELEKHKKTCEKLSNKINRLHELISKKNKNIKSMHRKIKYLGGVLTEQQGTKHVKYPTITESGVQSQFLIDFVGIDEQSISDIEKPTNRKQIDNHFSSEGLTEKSHTFEFIDSLHDNLIDEMCYDLQY